MGAVPIAPPPKVLCLDRRICRQHSLKHICLIIIIEQCKYANTSMRTVVFIEFFHQSQLYSAQADSSLLPFHPFPFLISLVWHRMTTYEYIVQQRPPQEMKEPDRQLESCPPQVRRLQVKLVALSSIPYKWAGTCSAFPPGRLNLFYFVL